MKTKYRNAIAIGIGCISSICIWFLFVNSNIEFSRLAYKGLIPPVIAGLIGGFFVAFIARTQEVKLSLIASLILVLPMLFFLFQNGFNNFGRNPFLWYWPIYVTPSFMVGAYILKSYKHGT